MADELTNAEMIELGLMDPEEVSTDADSGDSEEPTLSPDEVEAMQGVVEEGIEEDLKKLVNDAAQRGPKPPDMSRILKRGATESPEETKGTTIPPIDGSKKAPTVYSGEDRRVKKYYPSSVIPRDGPKRGYDLFTFDYGRRIYDVSDFFSDVFRTAVESQPTFSGNPYNLLVVNRINDQGVNVNGIYPIVGVDRFQTEARLETDESDAFRETLYRVLSGYARKLKDFYKVKGNPAVFVQSGLMDLCEPVFGESRLNVLSEHSLGNID